MTSPARPEVRRMVLERARQAKSQVVRNARYRTHYAGLHPPDYSRSRFRAEARQAIEVYEALMNSIPRETLERFDAEHCHPVWRDAKARFARSLRRGLPEDFLDDSVLRPQMVTRGWTELQEHVESYLASRPPELAALAERFVDSRVGEPHLECRRYHCSATSLGHLYYLVRILEAFPDLATEPRTVLELGGGYGNFARVYRSLVRNARYVIVDFPEMIAVQNMFLRLNGIETDVCALAADVQPSEGKISLLPVQRVEELPEPVDAFVSHFALSETASGFQQMIAAKRFLDSPRLYLTGQYTGLQPGENWEADTWIRESTARLYDEVKIHDFPVSWAYELSARREC